MGNIEVGDHVTAVCERHTTCKKLSGVVVAVRKGNFYTHQVKWEQKEKADWYSEQALYRAN